MPLGNNPSQTEYSRPEKKQPQNSQKGSKGDQRSRPTAAWLGHRLGLFSLEGTTAVHMTEVHTAVRDKGNKTRVIK